ncbi:ABC-type sugar transport system, permease component [Lactobacillus selangorensis]|uniref:ABC-type sugar transport system, permease component n=1 Tax=Lactobacillus selangorensis TaxID=81857 RepID=A0A0R2FX03_9LACO|nr:sugar ABC transporter permease [Lactobacillus selangorensis]KRN28878.1 ABC-type sugar transport system, permease component [Lactobacillus selangorensis]KRN32712.1 ABC-type sugar transport system, permease component [Lactobacillus selangorensis]
MKKKPTLKSSLTAYVYLLPMFIISGVFSLYPIVKSFLMSFYTKYNFYTDKVSAYGFDNYVFLWKDPNFHLALKNTLILVLGVVPLTVLISLVIALMLNHIKWLNGLFRTAYFLPFVTSTVAIALVWSWLFNQDYGLFNYLLSLFGIHAIDWLNDPHWAMPALIMMTIWKGLGFDIILFLVGLNNIDATYYKVATIDGANAWQRFKHITLPLLSPITFLVTITGIIGAFKIFDQIYALFNGQPGPGQSALTVVYYLYEKFYTDWKYGIAAASGVVLFLVILLITLIQFRYSRKHVHY